MAKAPDKNPFGDEEAPSKFADFDVFTKVRPSACCLLAIDLRSQQITKLTNLFLDPCPSTDDSISHDEPRPAT